MFQGSCWIFSRKYRWDKKVGSANTKVHQIVATATIGKKIAAQHHMHIIENPFKMDDLGVPPFKETPFNQKCKRPHQGHRTYQSSHGLMDLKNLWGAQSRGTFEVFGGGLVACCGCWWVVVLSSFLTKSRLRNYDSKYQNPPSSYSSSRTTNHKSKIKSHQQKHMESPSSKGIFWWKNGLQSAIVKPYIIPPWGPVGAPGGGTEFVSAGAAQRGGSSVDGWKSHSQPPGRWC